MPIQLPIPSREEARHIFRALLREATYLPDPIARTYFKNHIIHRYRETNHRRYNPDGSPSTKYNSQDREAKLFAVARKGLKQLQNANLGITRPLQRVLQLTYGRTGKRRHELLDPLTRPLNAIEAKENVISRSVQGRKNLSQKDMEELPIFPFRLHTLMESQRKAEYESSTSRKAPKTLSPAIPEQNVWLDPLPARRVVNICKRWHGKMLSKALPPLPDAEWEYLRTLSTGELKWPGPVPQRTRPDDGVGTVEYSALKQVLRITPTATYKERVGRNPSTFTARMMRRNYAKLFRMCPKMIWVEEKQDWRFEWGGKHLRAFKRAS